MADLHNEILDARLPLDPIFFILIQFSVKFGQKIDRRPLGVGLPPEKILDSPLEISNHWWIQWRGGGKGRVPPSRLNFFHFHAVFGEHLAE